MTFEEKLKEKAKEMVNLAELPKDISAKIIGEPEFKGDARGNEGCYVQLEMTDKRKFKQKYTPTTYNVLLEAIEKLGGLTQLQNNYVTWTKQRVGRTQFERYYPIKQIEQKRR